MSTAQRYAKTDPANGVGLWGNMLLALLKGIVGWMSGSKALLADAFGTAMDVVANFASLTGVKTSQRLKMIHSNETAKSIDLKGETAKTILLSVVLLVLGLEMGISAVRDMMDGVMNAPNWTAIPAIMIAILLQQLFLSSKDRITGLYCSLTALAGASGAVIGEVLTIPALFYCDPAAALVIGLLIMVKGFRSVAASVRMESKGADTDEASDELMQLVQRVEGVITVQSLRAREQGHYVIAEIVISVNPRISVLEGNEIAKKVKLLVLKRFIHITEVSIYVEPYDPGFPYKSNHDPNQVHMPTLLQ